MRNPKDFKPTPYNYNTPIDKSGGTHWDSALDKQGGSRKETKTADSYFKPNVGGPSNEGIGNPRTGKGLRNRADMGHGKGKHTPPVGTGMLEPIDMSDPGVPKDAVKWYRKTRTKGKGSYNMTVPASEAEALPITGKMKRLGPRSSQREEKEY